MKSFFLILSILALSFDVFSKCFSNSEIDKELERIKTLERKSQIKELFELSNCNVSDSSKAKVFKNIALYYYYINENNDLAIKYVNREIELWKKYDAKFVEKLADAYFNLGFFYFNLFEYDKSIHNYQIAERFTFDAGFKALIFKEISELYIYLGDYSRAEMYSRKGIMILKKDSSNQYVLATCFNALGISLEFQGKWDIALNNYEQAKRIIKKNRILKKERLLIANVEYNIGKILSFQNKKFQALNKFKKSAELFKNTDKLKMIVLSNLAIANILDIEFRDYHNAARIFDESIKIMVDSNLNLKRADIARFYSNASIVYLNNKEFSKSKYFLEKAFLTFPNGTLSFEKIDRRYLQLVSDKWTFYDLLRSYSTWYLIENFKLTGERSFLMRASQVFNICDTLIDLMREQHLGFQNNSKFHWRERTHLLFENAIETCYLLKDYEKAYYFMEKSRAVMLNDKLNELGAKQKLNEVDQEKEREYQRKIIELNTKIEAETKVTEKEKLNSQLFDLQEHQERFVKSLETKYPAYYHLKYNTQIGTLKQMQAYLKTNFEDKNATMVSYFFGDSASYATVISPTKAEVKQFKYDVAQNQEFVNLLATNQGTKADYARILSMGSVVYQKLIKPLNLPKGHLIISQDGVFMPFEALSTSAISAQYLLKDYAISYTYSGQFLLKKATETNFWPNQSFVGFAPVEFKNQLNTLKNSEVTLENVAKNYWFSDTFTGKVATKANFLQQAKDHKIVQIFTHAFADSVDTEPKIYFADDALKISELNAEDQFNTQLLVLSACKTGVGKLAKGEGVLSLARGFSMLGIPATITSLWSVEDKNTYQLTELFYKYLNQGLSKDQALQKAKLEFLELHPNSGPTDWAGMVLVGQTSQLTSNTPAFLVLGVIFSFAIIAGGLYFSRKRKAA